MTQSLPPQSNRPIPERLANALFFLSGILLTLLALGVGGRVHAQDDASIWDRAMEAVTDTTDKYTSDEAIADYVIASVAKQDRVNRILTQKRSLYRVSDLTVVVSVPPALHIGISEKGAEDGSRKR